MRDIFAASLCRQGILGGEACLKEDKMALLFPTVTVRKKNGNTYKYIVFNRKKFLNRYIELKNGQ